MPTNLPPEAADAEKRYRAARTTAEKITTLEEYFSFIPKHKGTDKLRAHLRRRLSKLKSSTQGKKKTSKQETTFHVEKEGAGQVVVIGSSNSGKSSLVSALTHAKPLVSEAPFTTWAATPGMMPIENIQVQLVDTPPLNRDFVEPELIELIRLSDMILFVVDLQTDPLNQIESTLELLKNHRIVPSVQEENITEKDRINFLPFIILANKCDDESYDENYEIFCELLEDNWIILPISITNNRNLEKIKETVFDGLEIMRVYSKAHGRHPDLDDPFVLRKGSTVEEFAGKVHLDFTEKLKTARVWGKGVHDGQLVGRDHILQDEDVVELHI